MTRQLVTYLLIGLVNTGFGLGAILLLQNVAGLSPSLSNACGYLLGLVLSYLLNRRFTFNSARSHRSGLPLFVLMAAICYGLNLAVLHAALRAGVPASWAQVLALGAYTVAFYIASRNVVFRHAD